MKHLKEHFLALLTMELDDMKEDLEALARHCAARREKGEISDYVCRENLAGYKNLGSDVDTLLGMLKQVDLDQYAGVPEIIVDLEKKCRERLAELGWATGMARTLRRKMEKIATYLGANREVESAK